MPSLARMGWRPSADDLMKPTADFEPPCIRSSLKVRAVKYLRRKLAIIKKEAPSEQCRLRCLAGSPPPPLGQVLGSEERVRTNISYDDYGSDDMLYDDDLEGEIPAATGLGWDASSTSSWGSNTSSINEGLASYSVLSFDDSQATKESVPQHPPKETTEDILETEDNGCAITEELDCQWSVVLVAKLDNST
ncbi:hypothetical protein EKO27_g4419 [Xylaria grammica]|uniref:Uncharacterized protein n=1 Tax=Xylaria grammica TaxID=363999 RepID=A0A439D8F5_9PEZI|nr:hypothetical protein EKO27_g4419 [Xylaria grammica]